MSKILFYSPVSDLELFQRVGFYATDIKLLRELGHEVVLANKLHEVINECYDVLFAYFYTWSSIAVLIARIRGKFTIMTGGADELEPSFNNSRKKIFLHRQLFRLGYFFSSRILAVSSTDFNNFSKLVGNKKISIAPHVVDTNVFTPGLSRVPWTLLTIGWMATEENVRRKGMDHAIRILAALRAANWNAHLIIAGTYGSGSELLMSLASELGVSDSVDFRFNISEEEKVFLLQTSCYYLQLSKFEGFGLAALEALSCGSCVIHTGRGGLVDFMHNYGLLQPMPLQINNVAMEIIKNSASISIVDAEAFRRHSYVVQNFSLVKRSKAFAELISMI